MYLTDCNCVKMEQQQMLPEATIYQQIQQWKKNQHRSLEK